MKYTKCCKLHFIKRFEQRIGIKLTESEYQKLKEDCMNRRDCIYKGRSGSSHYRLLFKFNRYNMRFTICADMLRNELVTVTI